MATASLQSRVDKLEAAARAEEDAMYRRYCDFHYKHLPGACAANPDLEAEEKAFWLACDAAALVAVPPADYCPEKSDRAWTWAVATSEELWGRLCRIHETVANYAAEAGQPWID